MKAEGIRRRIEEIEADAARGISNPDTDVWLCRMVRQLVARLEKLEKAAEAADDDQPVFNLRTQRTIDMVAVPRDYLGKLKAVAEAAREYVEYEQLAPSGTPARQVYEALCKALAALEED